MKKIDKTIVVTIDKICYTIRYTEDSITVIHKCNAFTDSNFSNEFKEVIKKHGLENKFIRTADSILDAVVNDRVRDNLSKAFKSGKFHELLKDI